MTTLQQALEELSTAHGRKALTQAFNALQEQVARSRRTRAKALGRLARIIAEALNQRAVLKANGATDVDIAAGFEAIVRASWPFTREWHYLCEACRDTGLGLSLCPGGPICGRHRPHAAHEYGQACTCQKGLRFKAPERTESDPIVAAAQVEKRKFSRFGS